MSYLNKQWMKAFDEKHLDVVLEICEQFNMTRLVAKVLVNRGVTSAEAAMKYFDKSLQSLHNPFLLRGMEAAAGRLEAAIANEEKITIYGDYDVDGITASALLYLYLKSYDVDVEVYIPDRVSEGYGLNREAICAICQNGTNLIVTVDCGITAVEEVALAGSLGVDVIVTDHHTPKDELPGCVAVVDPKRADCRYPFKELAGVGVAFKLVCALEGSIAGVANQYMDLVALGTVADIVSLTDENRCIVWRGIEKMRQEPGRGLKALMQAAGVNEQALNAGTLGFTLAPRLNASGRMANAKDGFTLLTTGDGEEAYMIAARLNDLNAQRQKEEKKIFDEAVAIIEADGLDKKPFIVVAKEGWHHGVIGIAASRIVEKYYKPCLVIALENGVGKGSGRSISGLDLFGALTEADKYLEKFGGHAMAAGITVAEKNLKKLEDVLCAYCEAHLSDEDYVAKLEIDATARAEDFNIVTMKYLRELEPFGMGNKTPVFALCGVEIKEIRPLSEGKHVKLVVAEKERTVEVLAFSMGGMQNFFFEGDEVDVCGTMSENCYNGKTTVQLLAKDIRHTRPVSLERAELAAVYRYIRKYAENLVLKDGEARLLAWGGVQKRKVRCCVDVFCELSLLMREEGGLRLINTDKKVDLTQSPLFMRLKAQEG